MTFQRSSLIVSNVNVFSNSTNDNSLHINDVYGSIIFNKTCDVLKKLFQD